MGCVIFTVSLCNKDAQCKKNILGVIDLRVAKIYALIPARNFSTTNIDPIS